MKAYVANKNAEAEGTRPSNASVGRTAKPNKDLEDLKFHVQQPNTGQTRTNNQHLSRQREVKLEGVPHARRQASGDQQHFYDTDASDIDRTSATTSLHRADNDRARSPHNQQLAQNGHNRSRSQGSAEDGEEYEDGSTEDSDAESEEVLPENPLPQARQNQDRKSGQQLNEKQLQSLKQVESNRGVKPDGSGLPYIKGDSYPSTTDGVPSVSEAGVKQRAQAKPSLPAAPSAPQAHIPSRTMRQQIGTHNQAQPRHQQPDKQARHANVEEPVLSQGYVPPPIGRSVEEEGGNGHLNPFARPGPQRKPMQQVLDQSKVPNAQQPPAPTISANTAQPSSNARGNEVKHRQNAQTTSAGPGRAQQQQQHASRHTPSHNSPHIAHQEERPNKHAGAPEVEPMSEVEAEHQDDNRTDVQQQSGGEVVDERLYLDYDPSQLYGMDYAELKGAKFDTAPGAGPFAAPDLPSSAKLADQLAHVSSLDGQSQAHFFSTIDIEQWEEAGDWFLESFGDLLKRFKTARREKREAARAFEDEIERRHHDVSKKRKLTEDALSEMKTSGNQVLVGTPKRQRKSK